MNILFIDPMRNFVLSLLGVFFSRSAMPYAPVKIGFPSFAKSAVPANLSAAESFSSFARSAADQFALAQTRNREFRGSLDGS